MFDVVVVVVVVVGESRSTSTLERVTADGDSPREKPIECAASCCVGEKNGGGGDDDGRSIIPPKSGLRGGFTRPWPSPGCAPGCGGRIGPNIPGGEAAGGLQADMGPANGWGGLGGKRPKWDEAAAAAAKRPKI